MKHYYTWLDCNLLEAWCHIDTSTFAAFIATFARMAPFIRIIATYQAISTFHAGLC
jgi:hypothetical protein